MIISVTEFIPPNGEQRTGYIEIPDATGRKDKYDELCEAGCTITAELLTPGVMLDRYQVCTYISCEEVQDDFVIHRTAHPTDGGPSGQEAAGQAIDKWDRDRFLIWKARLMASEQR